MPSTVIHVGFAALIAAALLRDEYDLTALAVVLGFAAFPDLDTFLGFVAQGAHRTVLHNLVLPTVVLAAVVADVRLRDTDDSFILSRWGKRGYRIAVVGIVGGWMMAGVLLDAFYNGVNLLWPLHDEFIDLSGALALSDQRGIVQTFIELDGWRVTDEHTRGTTSDMHYYTGVDPGPDADEDVERYFPIFDRGDLGLVAVTGYAAAAWRLWEERCDD